MQAGNRAARVGPQGAGGVVVVGGCLLASSIEALQLDLLLQHTERYRTFTPVTSQVSHARLQAAAKATQQPAKVPQR